MNRLTWKSCLGKSCSDWIHSGILLTGLVLCLGLIVAMALPETAVAQNATDVQGTAGQAEMWRTIRQGGSGSGGQLIQWQGQDMRQLRNGALSTYGGQVLVSIILLLGIFFILRGRVKIDHGWAGKTIQRFNSLERIAHWILAGSFIILALTGLNIFYGRYVLKPVLGADAFATITLWGKYAHNYVAFAFMLGVALILLLWIWHNQPSRTDFKWIVQGGGIVGSKHPPAKKFNFGQKVIFWLVVIGGISISLSGISLMFPFQTAMFAKTFAMLNAVGFDLSTNLSPMQEMQYSQVWHNVVSLFLIAVIIAHVYIGTIGMEGAFDAMGTGQVDLNWAQEHHSLWVDDLKAKGRLDVQAAEPQSGGQTQPAE